MTLRGRYGVYVVKIWQETTESESVWRASVMNTVTKERSYFATEAGLIAFLCPSESDEAQLELQRFENGRLDGWEGGDTTP